MDETKKFPKHQVFSCGNFAVYTYDFTIPNGEKAGTTLQLVELRTSKKRWSDETNTYFNQTHYVTISQQQLASFLSSIKAPPSK